jgi:hypothetical protein
MLLGLISLGDWPEWSTLAPETKSYWKDLAEKTSSYDEKFFRAIVKEELRETVEVVSNNAKI